MSSAVRGLVLKALVAVGATQLLLGLVLGLSIGALRVIHQYDTSFSPRVRVRRTYGPADCDRRTATDRSIQRRCTGFGPG